MDTRLKRCLLISLGAYGNNNLIPNGPEFEKNLRIFYKEISIFSSDKYYMHPRLIRFIFYLKEIFIRFFEFKKEDIFIHMNTKFALPIILSPFRKKGKIITWYSHPKISWITNLVLNKSDVIITGAPEIKNRFNNSILCHGIIGPTNEDIEKCKLKKNSKRDLIYLGRFNSVKRLDLFAEVAVRAFKQKLIDGVRIKAAPQEKKVEELVINKLKKAKIPFKINQNKKAINIYSFFQAGDIYLNMQSESGVGKAMLEACAVGIEVIVACKELKLLVRSIKKRTINKTDNICSALEILKYIKQLEYIQSHKEATSRIASASNYTVTNLVKNAIKVAYS